MRKNIYFHPILFSIYPVFALYVINFNEMVFQATLKSLAFSAGFGVFVYLFGRICTKSWDDAALFSSVILLSFFFYGHIFNFVDNLKLAGIVLGRHRFFLPVWLILTILILLIARRHKHDFNRYFNFVSAGLMIIVLIQIAIQWGNVWSTRSANSNGLPVASNIEMADSIKNKPDVYYIILDAYSRQDVLEDYYGFDNSDFIRQLEELGFIIPGCTQSNYTFTTFSITSSLNMDYLDALDIPLPEGGDNVRSKEFENRIHHSQVRRFFEELGYDTVTLKAVYPYLDIKDSTYYYDYYLDGDALGSTEMLNFHYIFVKTTLLRPVVEALEASPELSAKVPAPIAKWVPIGDMLLNRNYLQYKQSVYLLNKLTEVPDLPGRKFVYAHLFTTHQPFVFNADGTFRWPVVENSIAYRDQIIYTNKRILELLEIIITQAETQPIIILQGDHSYPWTEDRVKILNAYYLPDDNGALIYPEITPVNTFRIVLNSYFDTSNSILPDVSYYSPRDNPYSFSIAPPSCVE